MKINPVLAKPRTALYMAVNIQVRYMTARQTPEPNTFNELFLAIPEISETLASHLHQHQNARKTSKYILTPEDRGGKLSNKILFFTG